ncbi:MAG: hypothetical protein ABJM29_20050 [Rhizobiaceae bacterium]
MKIQVSQGNGKTFTRLSSSAGAATMEQGGNTRARTKTMMMPMDIQLLSHPQSRYERPPHQADVASKVRSGFRAKLANYFASARRIVSSGELKQLFAAQRSRSIIET